MSDGHRPDAEVSNEASPTAHRALHSRFDDRVADYAAARPGYPEALFQLLAERVPPSAETLAIDVGAGTGLATSGLLAAGYRVVAVEPNDAMKLVADNNYHDSPAYSSHLAPAESLPLADESAALVLAAQAFHWFDAAACRAEWRRVLRVDGWVALVWNEYDLDASPMRELDEIVLSHATDDWHTRRREAARTCRETLWSGAEIERHTFPNLQRLDRDGLLRRAASASYLPRPDQPGFAALAADLGEWFHRHADAAGAITLHHQTECHLGRQP